MTDTHTDKDLQACTAFMSLAVWKSNCRTFMCELVLRECKVLYSAVLMVSHCMTQSCSSCWDNRPHTHKCTHKTHSRRLQHSREHGHANYFLKKMCLCQGQSSVVCSCQGVVKKLLGFSRWLLRYYGLYYCNSLYAGISQRQVSRLQLVQNAAARLLTGTKKGTTLLQCYPLFIGWLFSIG